MSNLATRILVALVGIPVILLAVMAGGFYFFGLVLLIATLGLHEFYSLAKAKGGSPQTSLGMILGAFVVAVFFYNKLQYLFLSILDGYGLQAPMPSMSQAFLILFLIFVPLMFVVELFRDKGSALLNLSTTLLGVLYVSFFMGSLVGLRELFIPADFPVYLHFAVRGVSVSAEIESVIYQWGGLMIIAVLSSIWVCDSAAYFVGRAIGKRKLFPRVSPNKSWEGAIAGFIFAVGAFVLISEFALPYMSMTSAIICGSIVGIFGQIGDLAESLLKRDAGVKDSSALIPGHGGILDRFDSLLFVSPLIFYYLDFVLF